MGASIRSVLAESLLDEPTPLAWDEVSRHIQGLIGHEREKARIRHFRERQEFYDDAGHSYMRELINTVIKDPLVQKLRQEMVEISGFNPVTRRIINTLSTSYQDPALRTVKGKDNNKKYQEAQKACRQHDRARHWNRLANLHRTLLVGVRVRNIGSQKMPVLQPRLDIITPAQVLCLITSPKDPTRLEGVIIELSGQAARAGGRAPHAVLWTNQEIGYLDAEGALLGEPKEHGFDRMPLVMLRLDDDSRGLWSQIGASLISAHKADWFTQICLLKETKSATKQSILSGDLTSAARGQAADTESPAELPDGVAYQIADMSMDLSMFRDTGAYVVDTIASSNGISPTVLRHQGTQSAEARDLMRVPLRELRIEQQGPLREFERELAAVQSMVFKRDMPEIAFEYEGWHIDFADPQTPRSPKEQLEEFEHARRLRLTSTIKRVMEANPDLTRDQATTKIEENVEDELWFHTIQRPFMQLTGAMHGTPGNAPPASTGDMGDDGPDGRQEVTPTQTGEEESNGRAA